MKRFMWISAAALAVAVPLGAQVSSDQTTPFNPVSEYVVQKDDTLYDLANLKLRNPEKWRWLVEQNPILQESGRSYTKPDGTFVVLIRPGERLFGLEEVGVNIASPMPVSNNTATSTVVSEEPATGLADFVKDNWWWLLALIAGGVFALWLFWQLRRDPVESGRPQVSGGVTDETVHSVLDSRAWTRGGFTIVPGSVVRGHGYGTMMVSYLGGKARPRTLNGETLYRATVQHSRGRHEEQMYMLQGCGNDLHYNGYIPGPKFRFEREAEVAQPVNAATAVEPEPVVEAPPAQEEAALELTDVAPTADEPALRLPMLKIETRPAENAGDTSMVRVTGASTEDMTVEITDTVLTLRFRPLVEKA